MLVNISEKKKIKHPNKNINKKEYHIDKIAL